MNCALNWKSLRTTFPLRILLFVFFCVFGCSIFRLPKFRLKTFPKYLSIGNPLVLINSSARLCSLAYSNGDQVSAIESLCKFCVTTSVEQFTSGSDYYSNPKSQMGTWVDHGALKALMDALDDTELNMDSEFAVFCSRTPVPIIASVSTSEYIDINLIVLPFGTQTSSFTYAPGTLLLYRSLVSVQRLVSSISGRMIQNDTLHARNSVPEYAEKMNIHVLQRLGGPSRVLVNNNPTFQGPSVALEVILHPPSPGHASFDGGIGVKLPQVDDTNTTIRLSYLPDSAKTSLFVSHSRTKALEVSIKSQNDTVGNNISQRKVYSNMQSLLRRNIGGLGKEIEDVVRRLLLTRQIKASTMKALGLSHVKGVLFYGPPGTGKTLIAREIARALNARKPKIVNGPEVMDKYVGEAERNIRDVFKDAELEWAKFGEQSALHVLIFDEIDSIARRRGSLDGDGSGTRDSVVNQLLSKMDGIREVGNVIVVGLTNRRDLLDPALLRAGRFEVQVEVSVPDLYGRQEILAVLLRPMVRSGRLSVETALHWISLISSRTTGWTGSDLAGLIRSASSFALQRYFVSRDGNSNLFQLEDEFICLELSDIHAALSDVTTLSLPSKASKRTWWKEFLLATLPKPLALRAFGSRVYAARPSKVEMTARLREILNEDGISPDEEQEADGFLPEYDDENQSLPSSSPSLLSSPSLGNVGGTIIF